MSGGVTPFDTEGSAAAVAHANVALVKYWGEARRPPQSARRWQHLPDARGAARDRDGGTLPRGDGTLLPGRTPGRRRRRRAHGGLSRPALGRRRTAARDLGRGQLSRRRGPRLVGRDLLRRDECRTVGARPTRRLARSSPRSRGRAPDRRRARSTAGSWSGTAGSPTTAATRSRRSFCERTSGRWLCWSRSPARA